MAKKIKVYAVCYEHDVKDCAKCAEYEARCKAAMAATEEIEMSKHTKIVTPRVEPAKFAPGAYYVVVRGCGWTMDRDEMNEIRSAITDAIGHDNSVRQLVEAARFAVAEPYGCPMCDSGKLRDPKKGHWDNCGPSMLVAALIPFKDIA